MHCPLGSPPQGTLIEIPSLVILDSEPSNRPAKFPENRFDPSSANSHVLSNVIACLPRLLKTPLAQEGEKKRKREREKEKGKTGKKEKKNADRPTGWSWTCGWDSDEKQKGFQGRTCWKKKVQS